MTTRKNHRRPRSGRYPFTIDEEEGDEDTAGAGDVVVLDQTVIRGGRGDAEDDDDDDKSSTLLVVVDDDDEDQAAVRDDDDEAVLVEEGTIPIAVDTLARLPASSTTSDMEGDRLRAMEDIRFVAAEDRLADLRRRHGTRTKTTLAQRLANLPPRQWWAWMVILGVIFALAIVTIGLCEAPAGHVRCGRRSFSSSKARIRRR